MSKFFIAFMAHNCMAMVNIFLLVYDLCKLKLKQNFLKKKERKKESTYPRSMSLYNSRVYIKIDLLYMALTVL